MKVCFFICLVSFASVCSVLTGTSTKYRKISKNDGEDKKLDSSDVKKKATAMEDMRTKSAKTCVAVELAEFGMFEFATNLTSVFFVFLFFLHSFCRRKSSH